MYGKQNIYGHKAAASARLGIQINSYWNLHHRDTVHCRKIHYFWRVRYYTLHTSSPKL